MCLSFSGPSRTINVQNTNQTQPIVPAWIKQWMKRTYLLVQQLYNVHYRFIDDWMRSISLPNRAIQTENIEETLPSEMLSKKSTCRHWDNCSSIIASKSHRCHSGSFQRRCPSWPNGMNAWKSDSLKMVKISNSLHFKGDNWMFPQIITYFKNAFDKTHDNKCGNSCIRRNRCQQCQYWGDGNTQTEYL